MDEALGAGTPTGCSEDSYVFYRILKTGGTIVYSPDAYVWHRHRASMRDVRRQIYVYSKGHVAYHLTTLLRDADRRALVRLAYRCRKPTPDVPWRGCAGRVTIRSPPCSSRSPATVPVPRAVALAAMRAQARRERPGTQPCCIAGKSDRSRSAALTSGGGAFARGGGTPSATTTSCRPTYDGMHPAGRSRISGACGARTASMLFVAAEAGASRVVGVDVFGPTPEFEESRRARAPGVEFVLVGRITRLRCSPAGGNRECGGLLITTVLCGEGP